MFTVSDTGIGMTDGADGPAVPALRAGRTLDASKFGGTGLGLALARGFCQLMGGGVSVETPAGGGARFTVRLPVAMDPALERIEQPAA